MCGELLVEDNRISRLRAHLVVNKSTYSWLVSAWKLGKIIFSFCPNFFHVGRFISMRTINWWNFFNYFEFMLYVYVKYFSSASKIHKCHSNLIAPKIASFVLISSLSNFFELIKAKNFQTHNEI
jgi:hypothetical protein